MARNSRRPVTLFTGQWADMPRTELCRKVKAWGYDGVELACWGDHFNVQSALDEPGYVDSLRTLLRSHELEIFAISNHLVGQAVLDRIDERHRAILPDHVWGDGDPAGVNERAAEEMKRTAIAASKLGVGVVNGFTGSSIWPLIYTWPPTSPQMIADGFKLFANTWTPILDVFQAHGVKFALEVHPTEIAFDLWSAERALEAIDHDSFGFNFDPSHLMWQGIDPAKFIRRFPDKIFHVHMKDTAVNTDGEAGILGSHLPFGDHRRGWDFRSPGRGQVDFEEIVRALNDIRYTGPLSVEWEDSRMDREHGAAEALAFVRGKDFPPSSVAFEDAFGE
jgi:sugar phosphate isomerase/epimerase